MCATASTHRRWLTTAFGYQMGTEVSTNGCRDIILESVIFSSTSPPKYTDISFSSDSRMLWYRSSAASCSCLWYHRTRPPSPSTISPCNSFRRLSHTFVGILRRYLPKSKYFERSSRILSSSESMSSISRLVKPASAYVNRPKADRANESMKWDSIKSNTWLIMFRTPPAMIGESLLLTVLSNRQAKVIYRALGSTDTSGIT